MKKTRDPVNQELIKQENKIGLQKLGLMNSNVWHQDPKRLAFTLARYKFVSKMLDGQKDVAEIGCGDGFCARIVKQTVENLLITDYDPYFIERFEEIHSEYEGYIKIFNKVNDTIIAGKTIAVICSDKQKLINYKLKDNIKEFPNSNITKKVHTQPK